MALQVSILILLILLFVSFLKNNLHIYSIFIDFKSVYLKIFKNIFYSFDNNFYAQY